MSPITLELEDAKLIKIPKDKEVSCIEYTDGTCDLILDLPYDVHALIYQTAHEKGITADEAATKLVTEAVEHYVKTLDKEDKDAIQCKCKKTKGSKGKKH